VLKKQDDEPLSWKQRMRVAIGTASAMQYLHGLPGSPVIHGDLTSHNVFLTDDFSAKVRIWNIHSKENLRYG
jgi:Ser/Thr protein kinase RdoA (MazF antagonist)